jgi:hypothetical protein
MQYNNIPAKFNVPWGASAGPSYIRPIQLSSLIGIQAGAASLTDGFPPLCFTPTSAGGIPPDGRDMNGILNEISAWARWTAAGSPVQYDSGTSGFVSAIGGYPQGAILQSTIAGKLWLNLADNNSTNPDALGATNWVGIPTFADLALVLAPLYQQDVGIANQLQINPTTPYLHYVKGMIFFVQVAHTNTSTNVTISVNTLTAQPITHPDGTSLGIGDLKAGAIVAICYDDQTPPVGFYNTPHFQAIGLQQNLTSLETVTGGTYTYLNTDGNKVVMRSNSGNAMADTLPGTGPGVLPAFTQMQIKNNDTAGLLSVVAGSGAVLNGTPLGYLVLGPGQNATVYSDGSNYFVLQRPDRVRLGLTPGSFTTLYVNPSGGANSSDNNTGLVQTQVAGTITGPFQTIQHALNALQQYYDLNAQQVKIKCADGNYTVAGGGNVFYMAGPLVGQTSVSQLLIEGNTTTWANCTITCTANNAIAVFAGDGARFQIQGFRITSTGSPNGFGLAAGGTGSTINYQAIDFAACTQYQVGNFAGGTINIVGNYSISGGGVSHFTSQSGGTISCSGPNAGFTVTLTSTPNYSGAFCSVSTSSNWSCAGAASGNINWVGAALGVRCAATLSSTINTQMGAAACATFFPGSVNGTASPSTGGYFN